MNSFFVSLFQRSFTSLLEAAIGAKILSVDFALSASFFSNI